MCVCVCVFVCLVSIFYSVLLNVVHFQRKVNPPIREVPDSGVVLISPISVNCSASTLYSQPSRSHSTSKRTTATSHFFLYNLVLINSRTQFFISLCLTHFSNKLITYSVSSIVVKQSSLHLSGRRHRSQFG